MDGWTDGRTDGRMDGCCASQGGRGAAGEGVALRDGWFWLLGLLVVWWVCWLGRVAFFLPSADEVGIPWNLHRERYYPRFVSHRLSLYLPNLLFSSQ